MLTAIRHRSSSLIGLTVFMLAVSGCQSWQHTPRQTPPLVPSTNTPQPSRITAPRSFTLTGKIGVKTPQQTGSAFYAWAQTDERFAIDLSGALGIGQTHIEGVQGHVTLDSSKTGHLEAEQPETLLQQATGWQAPISGLVHWVMGVSAGTPEAHTQDDDGRLSTLTEKGWNVRFEYSDTQHIRPQKLVMTQSTPMGENRVILTVQTRTETP
jgi:outer membrane lipoprotein LolB